MELALLEKTFQNIDMHLTKQEASDKASLFLKAVEDNGIELTRNYWLQLSAEWDLNIYRDDRGTGFRTLVLYPVYKDPSGYSVTDVQEPERLARIKPSINREKLNSFLTFFEMAKSNLLNVSNVPGWFCKAEYEGERNGVIHINLRWGSQDGRRTHARSEHYRISVAEFNTAPTNEDIYQRLQG